jgi:hypothetical protein
VLAPGDLMQFAARAAGCAWGLPAGFFFGLRVPELTFRFFLTKAALSRSFRFDHGYDAATSLKDYPGRQSAFKIHWGDFRGETTSRQLVD